jgi:imidazoleglycerol phosphate synthase glutamine amidotransferase subunit HisH
MHSYALIQNSSHQEIGLTTRGPEVFSAAVREKSSIGLQFHPEKSSKAGIKLLGKILEWANGKI